MILVPGHRVKNAIRFKRDCGAKTWLLFGQSTAWPDDNHPPAPAANTSSLNSPFAALKATLFYVKEDPSGTMLFTDALGATRKFLPFADEASAIAGGCNMVIAQGVFTGAQLLACPGVTAYRQIGFATDVMPNVGVSSSFLQATDVLSWGTLESVDNQKPQPLINASTYTLTQLFEF